MLEIICAAQIALSIATEKAMETEAFANNIARASAIQNIAVSDKQQSIAEKLYASDYRRGADTRERSDEYRRDRDDRDRDRDRDVEDRDSEDSEVQSDYQKEAAEATEERQFPEGQDDSDRYEDDTENRRGTREEDDDRDRDRETGEDKSLEELLEEWLSD